MIRHTTPQSRTTSHLRFYAHESDDPFATYDAICTLVWDEPGEVWLEGFHGNINRALLRELLQFFAGSGLKLIKAHRADSRRLPFGKVTPSGHTEILVSDLVKRFDV